MGIYPQFLADTVMMYEEVWIVVSLDSNDIPCAGAMGPPIPCFW